MRIVFMGTPQFAVPCLRFLIESPHEVIALVCQPDKKIGRKQILTSPPTKIFASEHSIQVLQPASAKDPTFLEQISELAPDLLVTCAYGKILPESILKVPLKGCINVHASLLPKLRGAAPVQWAIINGDKETGITTMLTDAGMDTGAMLLSEKIDISETMTSEELHDQLMMLGPVVLQSTLKEIELNQLNPIPQNNELATYAPILKKEDGLICWAKSAKEIGFFVRGMNPWPGAFSYLNSKVLKICKAEVFERNSEYNMFSPGEVIEISKDGIKVACGEGVLNLIEVQPASGIRMSVSSYINGNHVSIGDQFLNSI